MSAGGERPDRTGSGRRSPLAASAVAVGVVVVIAAALLAPPQPELINGGGACQVAPCGTLEDPSRWHAAGWLWAIGVVLAYAGTRARPPQKSARSPWRWLLLPPWLLFLAVLALPVSWATSVQGAAAVVVIGTLPLARRRAPRGTVGA